MSKCYLQIFDPVSSLEVLKKIDIKEDDPLYKEYMDVVSNFFLININVL